MVSPAINPCWLIYGCDLIQTNEYGVAAAGRTRNISNADVPLIPVVRLRHKSGRGLFDNEHSAVYNMIEELRGKSGAIRLIRGRSTHAAMGVGDRAHPLNCVALAAGARFQSGADRAPLCGR